MKVPLRFFIFYLLAGILFGPLASGQTPVQLANIMQEFQLMQQQLGRLRLEVEQLQRQTNELNKAMETQQREQRALSASLNALQSSLQSQLQSSEDKAKREVIAEVSRQIQTLADQTQRSIDAVARVQSSSPTPPAVAATFSDDYPRTGVAYVVQPGDSLSKIARDHRSSVRDIQNANRIADPRRDLQVGMTIFVPQRNN